jgi:hypothetical protein
MKRNIATPSMIRIYRRIDQQGYAIMEFALVSKGYYVGWGILRHLKNTDFKEQGHRFILESLNTFSSRNGDLKNQRLKMAGQEPFHINYDLVSIEAIPPASLRLIPYRRGEMQHQQMPQEAIVLNTSASTEDFLQAMEEAFLRGQA